MSAEPYFAVEGITKRFGGLLALDGVSFTIKPGEITSLIGPNGAGKTTLFNVVTGLLAPDSGAVRFRGQDLIGLAPHRIARLGLGRTYQEVRLFPRMTVLDNVLAGARAHPGESLRGALFGGLPVRRAEQQAVRRARELLDFVGLADQAHELAGALSYGQQKLLSMAQLLAAEVDLLVLDEPVAGVRFDLVEQIMGVLRAIVREGRTALLIEHNMEAVMELSQRVVVLAAGRLIAAGPPPAIQQDSQVLAVYLGASESAGVPPGG